MGSIIDKKFKPKRTDISLGLYLRTMASKAISFPALISAINISSPLLAPISFLMRFDKEKIK